MKSARFVGGYQINKSYNPNYQYHFRYLWKKHASKLNYTKAFISNDVKQFIQCDPENMFMSNRYEDEMKYNLFPNNNSVPEDYQHLINEDMEFKDIKKESYIYNQYDRLSFDKLQACLLTKTSIFDDKLVENKIELSNSCKSTLEKIVLKSNWWISDENKLPKRFSEKFLQKNFSVEYGILPKDSIRYLMQNILRYCSFLSSDKKRLFNEFNIVKSFYYFQNERIQFNEYSDLIISDKVPIPDIYKNDHQFDRENILKVLGPINPLIDLKKTKYYSSENIFCWKSINKHIQFPHIITINIDLPNLHNDYLEPEALQITQSEKDGIAIMKCFAHALSIARKIYGDDAVENCKIALPKPVNVLGIYSDGVEFNFIKYQLNSTDFYDDSISNIALIDTQNKLYSLVRDVNLGQKYNRYENLNMETFKKVLQFYNYGNNK